MDCGLTIIILVMILILTTDEELPRTELARLVSRLFFLRVSTSTLWESVT